jgi:hypothetical protein
MLTIENIQKSKVGPLRIAGEKWELMNVETASDVYQFVYRCIEAHPAGGLLREAVVNLSRKHTTVLAGGANVYELKCITNGKSRLVSTPDLKSPGLLLTIILRVIEGS